jgi:hypothetical protein
MTLTALCFGRIRGLIVLTIAAILAGCQYDLRPPKRPEGIPLEASWAGGIDGGGWVLCQADEPPTDCNLCTIWNEEGDAFEPIHYRLRDRDRNLNRAARASELHYTYVTGEQIGLQGGLELLKVGSFLGRKWEAIKQRNGRPPR